MKKIYSLLAAFFMAAFMSAQLTTEIVSPGVFKLTYGASDDYSFYEPGFEVPTFYVHCWISEADNTQGILFEDAWSNSNVTMNYDADAHAYIGFIDLNTKVFTNSNNTVAGGTTVQKIGIVFKDLQDGATHQSPNGEVVGPTTLPTMAVSDVASAQKSVVAGGKLFTSKKGILNLSVYDFGGNLVKKTSVKADGNAIELNLQKKGFYILNISDSKSVENVKFSY